MQVTPLLGTLPPLLVTPSADSPLEGWRFLPESTVNPPYYQSQTFEALYEWQFHTLAYAENEWKNATPWNAPSSAVLSPGETRTYGLQFRLSPSIRAIEDTLRSANRPVAVGVPGYVLPMDQTGRLFVSYVSRVRSMSVSPPGALSWSVNSEAKSAGWVGYTLTPHTWGRLRLTITYEDGVVQTVHYYVTKAAPTVISDLGNFLTTSQWFDNSSDPFHRSPSVISYDRSVNAQVKDDPRAWIPGLSDEAGAGSWLAATMKQYAQPNAAEVAKLEVFVNETLWGSVQDPDGEFPCCEVGERASDLPYHRWCQDGQSVSWPVMQTLAGALVPQSVYFYQPSLVPDYQYPTSIDWGNWWSWNQAASYATNRAYDFVHVTVRCHSRFLLSGV